MAKKRITFTEDQIRLIKCLRFEKLKPDMWPEITSKQEIKVNEIQKNAGNRYSVQMEKKMNVLPVEIGVEADKPFEVKDDVKFNIEIKSDLENESGTYGIRTDSLYGGTYLYEDMALILGKQDHIIKGTEEDPEGALYDKETMEYLKELDTFITNHLKDIFDIMLRFCDEGIKVGVTYWCYDYNGFWQTEEEK